MKTWYNNIIMKKILLYFLILLVFLFSGSLNSFAQSSQNQSLEIERARLEQQLRNIEQQITQNQQSLVRVRREKNTLANRLTQLSIQKAGLILKIQANSINLDRSVVQLTQAQFQLNQNQKKITELQQYLAVIINKLWRTKQTSLFDLFLSVHNFSDFYNNLHSLENITVNLNKLANSLEYQKSQLQKTQQLITSQKEAQQNLARIIDLQNNQVAQNIQEKNNLLWQTRGQEANYQATLKKNKQQATIIRNRIYSLVTVAANKQITFGQAVQIAQATSQATGVRAALLLAILTQESNLGRNVGTCNRQGDPPSKSWRVVMSPRRDQKPFIQITKSLGLNINITPISCPMYYKSGKQMGWGGAMGPAQFIPSTWLGYRSKITAITGQTANPWNIRDAFLAAGLKLRADGAGSRAGEWAAAMRYFSGGTNPAFSFYGDSVIATANRYQKDIDQLNSK